MEAQRSSEELHNRLIAAEARKDDLAETLEKLKRDVRGGEGGYECGGAWRCGIFV
jgi:hypothetical protein